MPEERRLVTILFADIVGSSAAGAAHDPEVVRRTLGRAFSEMRTVLEAHGGSVEKFIGDAVMAVFGVPLAHDDDPERAVRAAVALRERVAELGTTSRFPITLRIGVNTGHVVAGAGAETLVTGPAVNEAARLQQAAGEGEILVGALTRRLTGGGVAYDARRSVAAKGIGELEAHPVASLATALPEQHRGITGLQAPLVGRDEELRLLVGAYRKTASESRASLMTVFGSPGVGKSRLVRELIENIDASRVRRGRCLPYGEGITFWPLVEILREDLGIGATDTHDEATAKVRAGALSGFADSTDDADAVARRLTALLGLARTEDVLPDVPSSDIQRELRWGVRRYLERRADAAALVLVFDDIHWAEPLLLDVIEHLAEWARAPIFILCLARPELRDTRPGWGGGLMNAAAIVLEPLTAEESSRLVRELLNVDALPDALRAQVIARAEGNPLYIEEFLRMLIDGGHIERQAGRWVARASLSELVVPPTLQGLIAARLDQVPAAVKQALQRAAVVGKIFWPQAIASQGELPGRLEDLLLDAARREIVDETDERGLGGGRAYSFKHILIRDVAYEAIPKEERAHLHDAFGRWLESAAGGRFDEYADIVAHHAERAFSFADELGDPETPGLARRAFERLVASGRRAWRRKDFRATGTFYERAAAAAERGGATGAERAEAAIYAAMGRAGTEGDPSALAALRAAIEVGRVTGASRALVEALGWMSYFVMPRSVDEAATVLAEQLAAAQAIGDPEAIAEAMTVRTWLPWWKGDLVRHRALLDEAVSYAREHGVTGALAEALGMLMGNAAVQGDVTRALAIRDEFARVALESGSLWARRLLKVTEFQAALGSDQLEDAIRAAEEHLEITRELGVRELVGRGYQHLSDARFESGDAAGARDSLIEGLRWYDPETMRGSLPEAQWRLSRAYLALGDVAAARSQAEAGRASVSETDVFS
ncbi:MAG TPA: adenylate/guanylate cyclase domain-containing protein, partial [Candidatus Limnocylindria bacterium]|nr:adenylate/guanylate cyclase domain-containing protein [Candidatus Limnocylindria bacterium]